MSRKCNKIQSWLLDYHYGLLADNKTRKVEAHIEQCSDCSAELETMRAASGLASEAMKVSPSADIDDVILAAARRKAAEFAEDVEEQRYSQGFRLFKPSFVTALTALIVMTAFYMYYFREPVQVEHTAQEEPVFASKADDDVTAIREPEVAFEADTEFKDAEGAKTGVANWDKTQAGKAKTPPRKLDKIRVPGGDKAPEEKFVKKIAEKKGRENLSDKDGLAKLRSTADPDRPESAVGDEFMGSSDKGDDMDIAMKEMEEDTAGPPPSMEPKAPPMPMAPEEKKRSLKARPEKDMSAAKKESRDDAKSAKPKATGLLNKAKGLERKGDCDGAARLYRRIASSSKDKLEKQKALYRAGNCYAKQKRHSEAKSYYDELIEKYPTQKLVTPKQVKDYKAKASADKAAPADAIE